MPEYHRISERTFRLVSEVTDLRPFFLAWRALNIWHSIHIIWLPRDAAVHLIETGGWSCDMYVSAELLRWHLHNMIAGWSSAGIGAQCSEIRCGGCFHV